MTKVTIKKQTLDDVVLVARNAIDKIIEMRKQRTWVGLTDEDDLDWEEGGSLKDLVKAIESKLKEKNHG